MKRQAEAVNQIKELMTQRGVIVTSGRLTLPDNQQWSVLERNGRQIGIDSASGVWVRESIHQDWRCISMPCTVSGALQAVEFLTKE